MSAVAVSDLKARLSGYLERVKAGEEIIVTERGKAIARLVPFTRSGPTPGELEEMIRAGILRPAKQKLPAHSWDRPRAQDPEGWVLKALLEDSSAVVGLVLEEMQSPVIRLIYEEDPEVFVWWATRVECLSALLRAARAGRLREHAEPLARRDLQDLFAAAGEIHPTDEARACAERLLAVHPLSAADALQLAAALIWATERPAGLGTVSLDRRLREAAFREGFTVLPEAAGLARPDTH